MNVHHAPADDRLLHPEGMHHDAPLDAMQAVLSRWR